MTKLNLIPVILILCATPVSAQDFGEIQRRGLEPINRGQTIIRQERVIIRERPAEREEEPVPVRHAPTYETVIIQQAPATDFPSWEETERDREADAIRSAKTKAAMRQLWQQLETLAEE